MVSNYIKLYSESNRLAKQELVDMGLETDGMVESTSKLRDQIKALTGFDIMENEDTFKNIMDIIIGIGEEWENLTDLEQAGLLEALAGKQQSNALAAALQNVDIIKAAYETAENSEGSAQKELDAYLQSIEGRIQKLTNQVQEFWHTAIDTDIVKGVIDFLTDAVGLATDLVDVLGGLPFLMGLISSGLSIKNMAQGKSGGRAKNNRNVSFNL